MREAFTMPRKWTATCIPERFDIPCTNTDIKAEDCVVPQSGCQALSVCEGFTALVPLTKYMYDSAVKTNTALTHFVHLVHEKYSS